MIECRLQRRAGNSWSRVRTSRGWSRSPTRLPPLQRFLTYRLSQLGFRLNRQAAHLLRQESGLKLPEWRVLALLATHRQINAAGIEELTGIDRGLLSRTVRALEVRGLVVARRSEADRREVFVALTAAGRQVYKRQLPLMQARQAHLLDALDPAERRVVFRIVDKLLIAAEARRFD